MRVWLICVAAIAHMGLYISSPAMGQDDSLMVGEVKVFQIPFDIKSILNGSDDVVNLNVDGTRTLIMTGMAPGRTNLIILGSKDQRMDYSILISADNRDLVYLHEGPSNNIIFRCGYRCEREEIKEGESSPLDSALPSNDGNAQPK